MIWDYQEIKEKYKNQYQINLAIESGKLFRIEKGIYSDTEFVDELLIISKKYPNAILTMDSAFYYYGLTDLIPEKYHLLTTRHTTPIRDNRVVQLYENSDNFSLGLVIEKYKGGELRLFNRERLLVELIRAKNKLPLDYYKEIIGNYRDVINDMNMQELQDYIYQLPKSEMVMDVLQMEVL